MIPIQATFGPRGRHGTLRLLTQEAIEDYEELVAIHPELAVSGGMANHAKVANGVLLTVVCPSCGGRGFTAEAVEVDTDTTAKKKRPRTANAERAEQPPADTPATTPVVTERSHCFECVTSPVPGRLVVEVELAAFLDVVFNSQALR